MAYTVTVTATTAGEDIGNFTIRQNNSSGTIVASNVTRAQLVAGFDVSVANGTTSIYVESGGICDGTNKTATITGTPQPVPVPSPVPAPVVVPQPVPAPTVVPQPVPAPTVVPQPVPQPAPQPVPVPAPTAPSLTDGWRFTAGTVNVGGTVYYGYHQGTLAGCPAASPHPLATGAGSSPTTSTTALPGVDCYDVGGLFFSTKGVGLNGVGNVSSYALTQFSTETGVNTYFAIINTSGTGNPGSGTLSGTITGDNGTSGTWSVSYSPGPFYTDNDGTGTTVQPESTGTVSLSGITMANGVTYTLNT